jgi:hypothetical protein
MASIGEDTAKIGNCRVDWERRHMRSQAHRSWRLYQNSLWQRATKVNGPASKTLPAAMMRQARGVC